jgi:hypothetical protein
MSHVSALARGVVRAPVEDPELGLSQAQAAPLAFPANEIEFLAGIVEPRALVLEPYLFD